MLFLEIETAPKSNRDSLIRTAAQILLQSLSRDTEFHQVLASPRVSPRVSPPLHCPTHNSTVTAPCGMFSQYPSDDR